MKEVILKNGVLVTISDYQFTLLEKVLTDTCSSLPEWDLIILPTEDNNKKTTLCISEIAYIGDSNDPFQSNAFDHVCVSPEGVMTDFTAFVKEHDYNPKDAKASISSLAEAYLKTKE